MKNFLNFKFFVVLFAVLIIGLLLPFHQAEAWIGALASNIVFAGIAAVLEFITGLTFVILSLCKAVLNIATSPNFITIPYTSEGIVGIGWPIVRDFANLGFTLALIFIGLATALQLDEYGAKKALPRLLAMALLVNFTPVIAGIIIDASNIIMNFFLGATGDFSSILNLSSSHYSSTINKLLDFFTKSVSLEIIAEAVAISAFNLLAGFFFLLYGFLFLARYVAIWTLVIVSPLAFFANVFPKTSSYYKQWWQQFIQWCFIGIPASFFLYLSWHLLHQIDTHTIVVAPAPSAWGNFLGTGQVLSSLFVYSVVLVFLFIGFLSSLSSGAVGATAIIATAKGWGKSAVGSWKKGTGAIGQAKKGAQRVGRDIISGETIGGKGGLIDQMAGSKSWVSRQLALKGKELKAGIPSGIDDLMKDITLANMVKKDDLAGAMLWANNPLYIANRDQRMVAALAKISEEKGDVGLFKTRQINQDFERKAKQAAAKLSPDHLRRIVSDNPSSAMDDIVWKQFLTDPKAEKDKLAKIRGRLSDLAGKDIAKFNDSDTRLNDDLSDKFGVDWRTNLNLGRTTEDIINAGETDNGYQALGRLWSLEKTVRGLDMDAVTKLSPESINNPVVQDIFARDKNVNHLAKIDEKYGSEISSKFTYDALERIGADELAASNPQMLRAAFLVNQQAFTPLTNTYTKKPFKNLKEVNDFIAKRRPPGGTVGGPGPVGAPAAGGPVSPGGIPYVTRAPGKTPPSGGKFGSSAKTEEQSAEKKSSEPRLNFRDLEAGGQDGSVIGAKPCVIQGKAGTVKEVPFEVYRDPLSGLDRIRKTDGKNPNNLFITDTKAGTAPALVKNNEGAIINENMSYKIGGLSYRLSGDRFIIEK